MIEKAHVSNKKSAITSKSKLAGVAKHNLRKYKSEEYSANNIFLIYGTDNLVQDVTYAMDNYMEDWIGIEAAASYLDVTKDTIRNWIKKTDIPAHKIGKLWKFKRVELDAWVKSGRSAID